MGAREPRFPGHPTSRRNLDKNTIRIHPSAKEDNHPGTCVMCHCPGGVAFRAATPWRNRGMSDIPQSAVEELANFCDVSSSRELRTNPPVIDGSTKPWNAGGVATSPEGRCAGSCSLEGLEGGVTPCPKAHNYRACCRPGRSPRPDRKGGFTADAPVPETGGRPSPICFSPGKDSCTRQAVTGLPARKELLATP